MTAPGTPHGPADRRMADICSASGAALSVRAMMWRQSDAAAPRTVEIRFVLGLFAFALRGNTTVKFLSRVSHARVIRDAGVITTHDILHVTTWRGAIAI
ncbi:hypothetical protein [Undibacter mobilis]|uniref:hypothetical protein n=1 Tax=Undibacter mobilis TaxID=2292256 RepID=UPI00143D85D0|nr:hypothetical protein [Undibacter mobilis]